MATVNSANANSNAVPMKRVFIGRAWINTVRKEGPSKGVQFLNLKFDRGMNLTLGEGDQVSLWPNKKREGKVDADYRASIQVPA